jgi:hypothetical protein
VKVEGLVQMEHRGGRWGGKAQRWVRGAASATCDGPATQGKNEDASSAGGEIQPTGY